LIVVGVIILFVGSYALFLWYTGDIGSRPKLYANPVEFEFGKYRGFFWPIYNFELAKLLPMCMLFFCSLYVYVGQRDIKDSMLVGGPRDDGFLMGNVANSWTKLLGVLPFALISSSVVLKLLQKYELVFVSYIMILGFTGYFLINAFFIYPYREKLHIGALINWFGKIENKTAQEYALGILGILAWWPTSLHYIASELWGTITLSFCCWGYINLITKKKDASRWYPCIALPAQFAQFLAGKTVDSMFAGAKSKLWTYESALIWLNFTNLLFGLLFCACFWWLKNFVLTWPRFNSALNAPKKKKKIGTCAALKFAFTNPHALCICGLVFFYGMVNAIQEITYKDLFSAQYDFDKASMAAFKAKETMYVAGATAISMLFIGSNMLKLFGWLTTAWGLPVVMAAVGIPFYICTMSVAVAKESINWEKGVIGETGTDTKAAWGIVWLGFALIVLVKSLKYSLFDPTKEMAYLPLSKNEKNNAKAVVDIIGARGGKSFGSLFNVIVASSLGGVKGYENRFVIAAFVICMIGLGMWFVAAFFLDRHIKNRERKNAEEEEAEAIENPVVPQKESLDMEEKATDVELMSSVEPKESGDKLL